LLIDHHSSAPTFGFCKVVVDRKTRGLLGCHVVGERAVEIVQLAAKMPIDDLLRIPFPSRSIRANCFARSRARRSRTWALWLSLGGAA
jgi:hypothetical protein